MSEQLPPHPLQPVRAHLPELPPRYDIAESNGVFLAIHMHGGDIAPTSDHPHGAGSGWVSREAAAAACWHHWRAHGDPEWVELVDNWLENAYRPTPEGATERGCIFFGNRQPGPTTGTRFRLSYSVAGGTLEYDHKDHETISDALVAAYGGGVPTQSPGAPPKADARREECQRFAEELERLASQNGSKREYVVELDGDEHVTEDRADAERVADGWLAEARAEADSAGEWLESVEDLVVYERRVILRAKPRGVIDGREYVDYFMVSEESE